MGTPLYDDATSGRRQKLYNLMKNVKDVYIPTITQRTIDSFKTAEEPDKDVYQPDILSAEIDVTFYPTYTIKCNDNAYRTTIRLAVSSPGDPSSRKNKILLSLCKQFLRAGTTTTTTTTTNNNNNSLDDIPLDTSDDEEFQVLKSRLAGFFSRKIPNVPLIIDLIDYEENITTLFAKTDNVGNVMTRKETSFLPKKIRITVDTPANFPGTISKVFDCNFVDQKGVGLISDIDDTIKHTGITGDKKSMFRNVFVNDVETWLIQDLSRWYKSLKHLANVDFFYVSNSPSQIYPMLDDYISRNYPSGPLFLKQYSGNVISSIMTSSANRKLGAISKIFEDFPQKKFFLVGDSGEQDFEAYISTALRFPDQVIGIYIRCCKDSMSDLGLREIDTVNELNDIIEKSYYKQRSSQKPTRSRPPPPPIRTGAKPPLSCEQTQLIKQSRHTTDFQSNAALAGQDTPPPLPARSSLKSRRFTDPALPNTDEDLDPSFYFDKRAENWKVRVQEGISKLNATGCNTSLRLMFFMDSSSALEDSIGQIRNIEQKK